MSTGTRIGTKRRLRAAERRERILDAATAVFAEHGYVAASMGEIARRAGVVPSVIYDHFGSKRELHIELLELHGQALIERSIDAIELGPPPELFRASMEAFYTLVEEDPFAWRFLFRDPPSDPEIAEVWRRIHDRATEGIAGLILAGAPEHAPAGRVPPDTATWMFARLCQGATNGLAQWWYEHREVPREELVRLSMALLWEGFGELVARAEATASRRDGRRGGRRRSTRA